MLVGTLIVSLLGTEIKEREQPLCVINGSLFSYINTA